MACARHLGLVKLPIVVVNVDQYYEPFREMLDRAYDDELIKLLPEQIVHFSSTAEAAVRWIEQETDDGYKRKQLPTIKRRLSSFRRGSFYSPPPIVQDEYNASILKRLNGAVTTWPGIGAAFALGVAAGIIMSRSKT